MISRPFIQLPSGTHIVLSLSVRPLLTALCSALVVIASVATSSAQSARVIVELRLPSSHVPEGNLPDATTVVSGFGSQVGVWDVRQGKLVKVLAGHDARVTSVLVSADSRSIFSGDTKGNLRVWSADATTGITRLPGSSTHNADLVLRQDGRATGAMPR